MSGKGIAIISLVAVILGACGGAYGAYKYMDAKTKTAVEAATEAGKADCAKTSAALDAATRRGKILEFDLRLGHIAIQAGRMNYGLARSEATAYFDDLARFADESKGDKHEGDLRSILEKKDQIVNDLAVGSPTSADALELLYLSSIEKAAKP